MHWICPMYAVSTLAIGVRVFRNEADIQLTHTPSLNISVIHRLVNPRALITWSF